MDDYMGTIMSRHNEEILYAFSPPPLFKTLHYKGVKKGYPISQERRSFDLEHKDLGRNSVCNCGSEKKFKNCCLKNRPL